MYTVQVTVHMHTLDSIHTYIRTCNLIVHELTIGRRNSNLSDAFLAQLELWVGNFHVWIPLLCLPALPLDIFIKM